MVAFTFRNDCPDNFYTGTSQVENVTVTKLVIGFWTVTFNHKVNFFLLIKNIKWDAFY